jgi:hypothetical protein
MGVARRCKQSKQKRWRCNARCTVSRVHEWPSDRRIYSSLFCGHCTALRSAGTDTAQLPQGSAAAALGGATLLGAAAAAALPTPAKPVAPLLRPPSPMEASIARLCGLLRVKLRLLRSVARLPGPWMCDQRETLADMLGATGSITALKVQNSPLQAEMDECSGSQQLGKVL